jgi:hypothetical protein
MFNFRSKKGQVARAQKREQERIIGIVRDQILQLLLAECENVMELSRRIEAVSKATEVNITKRVIDFKESLKAKKFGELEVKALEGRGDKLEQKIIELLKDESLKVVDEIATRFPQVIQACIQKEMMERKPNSLKIEL